MIKDNQKLLNRLHVVVDALALVFSYISAWYIRFKSGIFELDPWFFSLGDYMRSLFILVPAYLILYYVFQLYTPKRVQGRRLEAWHIIQANVIGMMAFILYLYIMRQPDFSRLMIFVFFGINICVEVTIRNIIRESLRNMRRQGYNQKHIVMIGYSRATEQYIDRVRANPEWGYIIRGILADNVQRGTQYKGIKVIGRTENLTIILPENKLDEIVITLGLAEYHKLEHIVGMCEKSGVHTKFVPDYNNIIPTKPYTEDLLGMPVINIRRVPLNNVLNALVKRCVDVFGAMVALILFAPVMAVVAVIIKVTAPGPLIYSQERIGLQNKPFRMYKFRSMVVQDQSSEKKQWTVQNDPRVTPIGRFIRKTSIDELPQLINVLMGDMSLVGPRPERPQFVEQFKEDVPLYMVKHQVRPGITGWAQVNGLRGDTSIKARVEHDIYYIEHWSILFDIEILLTTIFRGKFLNSETLNG